MNLSEANSTIPQILDVTVKRVAGLSKVRELGIILGACIPAIISVLGLICNGLIIAVMKKKAFRLLPVKVHFTALAYSDSVAILSWQIMRVIRYGVPLDLRTFIVFSPIQKFLMNASFSISAWFVVYMAVERALMVLFPLKAKVISSPRIATRVVMVITITVGLMCSPPLWMADWSNGGRYLPQFNYFRTKIEPQLTRTLFAYLPIIPTCIFYFILLIKVIFAKIKRSKLQNEPKPKLDHFTKSVLVVFITFVLSTSPSIIYVLLNSNLKLWKYMSGTTHNVLAHSVNILRLLYYGGNFIIYVVTNRQFRKEAVKLISRKHQVEPLGSSQVSHRSTGETKI